MYLSVLLYPRIFKLKVQILFAKKIDSSSPDRAARSSCQSWLMISLCRQPDTWSKAGDATGWETPIQEVSMHECSKLQVVALWILAFLIEFMKLRLQNTSIWGFYLTTFSNGRLILSKTNGFQSNCYWNLERAFFVWKLRSLVESCRKRRTSAGSAVCSIGIIPLTDYLLSPAISPRARICNKLIIIIPFWPIPTMYTCIIFSTHTPRF